MKTYFSKNKLSSNSIKFKVLVAISFRDDGSRAGGLNSLIDYYSKEFKNFDIKTFDNDSPEFSLSQSRNKGIEYAKDNEYDIVLVSDADIFVNKDILIQSVLMSQKKQEIVIPFNVVHHLDDTGTSMFFNKNAECMNHILRSSDNQGGFDASFRPCGGLIIGPPDIFINVGMYDPNYISWGHEDVDFHIQYAKKYKKKFNRIDSVGLATFSKNAKRDPETNKEYYLKKSLSTYDDLNKNGVI